MKVNLSYVENLIKENKEIAAEIQQEIEKEIEEKIQKELNKFPHKVEFYSFDNYEEGRIVTSFHSLGYSYYLVITRNPYNSTNLVLLDEDFHAYRHGNNNCINFMEYLYSITKDTKTLKKAFCKLYRKGFIS